MTHYSIITIAALTGLWVLGSVGLSTPGAEGADWVVRPIALGVSVENLDVMAESNGEVVVGYAATQTGSGGDVTLASLSAGEKFFQRQTELGGGDAASFGVDRFGNIFYAAQNPKGGLRVGQDFGGFGGLLSSVSPAAGSAVSSAVPTMAVNPSGLPVLADMDKSGARYLSTFNVAQGQWQTEMVTGLGVDSPALPAGPNCQSLTFDSAGNPTLAYVRQTGGTTGPLVVAQRGLGGWTNVANDTATAAFGTSVAAAPDGTVGFAYIDGNGQLKFNSYNQELAGSLHIISSQSSYLTPHSLAYDTAGNPAIVYSEASSTSSFSPLYLARRDAQGNWTTEALPVSGQYASLTFDAQGAPLIVAYTSSGVTLLGENIAGLKRGDFDVNDTVDSNDVGGFVQALRHQTAYLSAHPNMAAPDLLPLGDYDGNNTLDDRDARLFADSLTATPLPGLSNRKAGYTALDQADANPTLGSGKGNFFGTVLATNKAYQAGDSRGDLTGVTPGEADGTVNAADINYLFAHLDGSDPRADLNGDGVVNHADADTLVKEILGTFYGDANLDGVVDFADLTALAANYGKAGGWAQGDFNGDGKVDFTDLTALAANYNNRSEPGIGMALATAGLTAVPEPPSITMLLTVSALVGCWMIGLYWRDCLAGERGKAQVSRHKTS